MALIFPAGLIDDANYTIVPGIYAAAGAAALSGAATHTISTTVIVIELTGQIHCIVPLIITVLIANFVAKRLQPSIYDSIIKLKNLPFLPHLDMSPAYQQMRVEHIMQKNVTFLTLSDSYGTVRRLLDDTTARALNIFPVVDKMGTKKAIYGLVVVVVYFRACAKT